MLGAPIGIYLHIPFCRGKCPYCDFYSLQADEALQRRYLGALGEQIRQWGEALPRPVSSVYFGGGTPSLLDAAALADLLQTLRGSFSLLPDAEITMECNPSDAADFDFRCAALAGVNRVSLGLQSAREEERKALGRRAGRTQAEAAITAVRAAGIHNISLDIMLGIPRQTEDSLRESIAFCARQGVQHVSAYLLKIEEGTPFATQSLDLPDEDTLCALYLQACEALERAGFRQYEISNFAQPGRESRHNLLYWDGREYLGLGPAAHSFLEGRRFSFPRDLEAFLHGARPQEEGVGGDFAEYAMLRLRLNEGLTQAGVQTRFGHGIPALCVKHAEPLQKQGLLQMDDRAIRLTREGFLLSNRVIGMLLKEEE